VKRLKIHRSLAFLELVAEIAQPLQLIIDIEKSGLPSHRIVSNPSVTMESERLRIAEVLRSIQLAPRLRKAILKDIGKGDLDDGFTAREIYRKHWADLSERTPLRKTSVRGSPSASGAANLTALSWIMAYRSFGGEVEAWTPP